MAFAPRSKEDMLEHITRIRVRNNDLWMGLMAIALETNPEKTKELIRDIARNDAAITMEMLDLAHAPNNSD